MRRFEVPREPVRRTESAWPASAGRGLRHTPIDARAPAAAHATTVPPVTTPSRIGHDFSTTPTRHTAAASQALIAVPAQGLTHPLAASMSQPGTRFRLPEFDRIKAAYTDKDLKIPEAVLKGRVTELLERMEKDGRLKSKEPVATLVAKIFPGAGKLDEAEFNKAIDIADRTRIYKSVTDADTQVTPVDKPALQSAMKAAAADVKTVEADAAGLTQVFGTKDSIAKANYAKARKVLEDLAASSTTMDAEVTTDYNLDDPEVGLGGWANFDDKRMHLLLKVTRVTDLAGTKATVIHEAAHFANKSVDDFVYYDTPGFFEADETKKVENAAHYEELPRRLSKTSKFDKKTFTPGVMPGGAAATREDKVKAAAGLYLRQAWDAGVDAHTLIRGVRRKYLAGNNKPFNNHRTLILEISKLMDLTVHEQAAAQAVVTTLDVTLTESISHGVAAVRKLSKTVPFPSPVGTLTDDELRDKIVAAAVVGYGHLLKDATRDKALLDWLVAHYRSLPSV